MNQLGYHVAQHPGPFAQHQGNLAAHAYPSQGFSTPPQQQQQQQQQQATATAPHAQSFASAPYPGHAASSQSRPQAYDGLVQQAPQPPAAGQFAASQQSAFTSAPYSQSVSATATPSPAPQQPILRHSASPQQANSPFAGQQFQQPKQQTPPVKYPMAAPPLPQTPGSVQASANATGSPQTPQSPGSQAREQRRIELLLDINLDLLREINNLQASGLGGATSPQHQAQMRAQGIPDKMATDEYIQCLRRVQANLAYLAPRADPHASQKAPPGPAHMTPPAHMSQLQAKYDQLKELFPGWAGHDARPVQPTGSPSMNMMNSMNGMGQMQQQQSGIAPTA